MFSTKDINESYVLEYLNYRKSPNMGISGSDVLTLDDFEISNGRMHNEQHTVNIQPTTGKFIPFTLTEKYYNDVVLHIASIERNSKI